MDNMAMNYHRNADYPPAWFSWLSSQPIVIPQPVYNRAPAAYPQLRPITFFEGQTAGVNLQAALDRVAGMTDGDARPTTTVTSTKIKIRLMWPQYEEFSKDISAKQLTKAGEAIPKWKLAFCVARIVRAFYERAAGVGTGAPWDVQNIPFGRLRLLELRQVSTGSWQPVLILSDIDVQLRVYSE